MSSSIGKRNGAHSWERTLLLCAGIVTGLAAYNASAIASEDNTQQIARCAALQKAQIKNTQIELAQALPANSNLKSVDGTTVTTSTPVCRVVATVSTAPEKHLGIEVWLPLADWNGRLLGTGKTGFGGYIDYNELAAAVTRGFVAVNSDTGYKGRGSGEPGKLLAWAANRETLRGWGHLSVHLMTVIAKKFIQAYYGQGARYSYLDTCGGVEAMTEVEYFPDDYDGVEARSPGVYYSHLMESFLWGAMLPAHQPDALLTHDALALLNHAVLQNCGGAAALEDGFLEHAMQCHFDPAQLQCKTGDNPANCLSAVQVHQAQRLYSPPRNVLTGEVLYPGFARGSELGWGAIQNHLAAYYAQPLLASAVFDNAGWDWTTYDFGTDSALVDQKLAPLVNATNPDISRFARRGGKVIMTQGWADEINAPTKPIEYFDEIVRREGSRSKAQRFFRLFMVPGMGHCGVGPGPTTIGGSLPPTKYTWNRDVVSALEAWVEHGKAPPYFISTKYVGDKPNAGVKFERPVCVYPMEPRYNGSGNRNLASSFSCVSERSWRGSN